MTDRGLRLELLEPEKNTSPHQHRVTIVTATTFDEVIAATQRDAEGEAIPKQQRTDEQQKVPVYPKIQNPQMRNEFIQLGSQVRSVINTARKAKKTRTKKEKMIGILGHVGKYVVLSELSNAPNGLKYEQLVCGDADEAKKEIRRPLTKGGRRGRALAAHVDIHPLRLRLIPVRIYGTEPKALLDSGATPNLMCPGLVLELSLSPEPTMKRITVVDRSNSSCTGTLKDVPTSFAYATVHLDFLAVDGTPFDVIIGLPLLEDLQACFDVGKQLVKAIAGDKTVKINLVLNAPTGDAARSGTDSEEFTSDSRANTESSTSDEDEFVPALADSHPFEPDIVVSGTT